MEARMETGINREGESPLAGFISRSAVKYLKRHLAQRPIDIVIPVKAGIQCDVLSILFHLDPGFRRGGGR
jgi:hypothetical protein